MSLTMTVDGIALWWPAVVALGLGVGLIAGMFGVGGGFLMAPLLHVVLGVPLPAAVGASLCVTVANATGSFLRYRHMGLAEPRFDVMMLGGSLLGVDAGTRLLGVLEGAGSITLGGRAFAALPLALTVAYGALFLAIAALLWLKPVPDARRHGTTVPGPLARLRFPPYADLPAAGLRSVSGPVVAYLGFAVGVLGGLLGSGGGILMIPILIYGFGFGLRQAVGKGIIVVLVMAGAGAVQHARVGNVHLPLVLTIMVGSALAAQVGALLTRSLPAGVLRKTLALVMLLTVAAMVYDLVR